MISTQDYMKFLGLRAIRHLCDAYAKLLEYYHYAAVLQMDMYQCSLNWGDFRATFIRTNKIPKTFNI